jgi:uncharacterized protein YacL
VGGVVGRTLRNRLDQAPERFAPNRTGPELFAGAFGLMVGLAVGAVAAVPFIVFLPPMIAWPLAALVLLVSASFSARLFASRADDLLDVAGLHGPRPMVARTLGADGPGYLLDTSAAIDGRILELARAGLVQGRLWIPAVVLDELQGISDSPDRSRCRRGRRGLDIVNALQGVTGVDVVVLEETVPEFEDVDAKLMALAQRADATLVTTDHNLARAAEARGVHVLSPTAVADSLKTPVAVGERVLVPLTKPGTEPGQAVGYLADGTMVVVESGTDLIGQEVTVEVVSATRTSVGRMLFARVDA